MSQCVKVDTLERLCDDNLERSYDYSTTTNVYFIGAAYNFYFLIIYKPSSLIISPRTFSMQLGAGTAWFCLSQCAIPFCTLSAPLPIALIDGTVNAYVNSIVTLPIEFPCGYSCAPEFYVTKLEGTYPAVLSYSWLSQCNPTID